MSGHATRHLHTATHIFPNQIKVMRIPLSHLDIVDRRSQLLWQVESLFIFVRFGVFYPDPCIKGQFRF